jgi:hypothetical protein
VIANSFTRVTTMFVKRKVLIMEINALQVEAAPAAGSSRWDAPFPAWL